MRKKRIALIFGGKSQERAVSLKTGQTIARNLDAKKYEVIPIEIDKSGRWLVSSPAIKKIARMTKIEKLRSSREIIPLDTLPSKKIDAALLALHGPGGEDGTIQGMLELLGIKYTCSGVLASAVGMDKARAKRMVAVAGVRVLPDAIIHSQDPKEAKERILNKISGRVVVKPNRMGSSIGVAIASKKEEILRAVARAQKYDSEILLEPFVEGREITVPVLGNRKPRALPAVEILPWKRSKFYDFSAKYQAGGSEHLIPAPLSPAQEQEVKLLALKAHVVLGCRGVTRSDFILGKDGKFYFLEINTIPGMTPTSLVPQSARIAGISFPQLLDTLIKLAMEQD